MEYLKNVYLLLKKCTWRKLSSAIKVTGLCLLTMVVGGFFYWIFDILWQLLVGKM
ncbi:preprotein translocase subunit SecE [Lactobacillus taiwanensis]|uniref:preprotein translocase subunit SecE n=1 Tax=Lactobacillus taiwanensis TaxID=508451 RepID=UPI001AEC5136|nr:preprotein translocase subunit SecE [Lactobacillus taiwanensis]QTQ40795.1 preprotein translocase subunit SecE [Lactobacillus taiwanensis]